VVCGESTLAVFVQIVGGSCNVTTEQTSNAGASKQGPRACSAGEIFPGKACTAMPGPARPGTRACSAAGRARDAASQPRGRLCCARAGALTITVTPGANQKGLVKSETEPDLAGAISQLGLSGLSARPRPARTRSACATRLFLCVRVFIQRRLCPSTQRQRAGSCDSPLRAHRLPGSERRRRAAQALGALSVDVLFGDFVHVQSLALLPSLQRITGVPAAAAAVTGLPQPIMSQLRITGGLGTSSPHSFASVAFQPMEINGMLQARRPGRRLALTWRRARAGG
jgi:hypothetical protein